MHLIKLTKNKKSLRRRILDVSFEANTSHIGSCLAVVDLIDEIYNIKKEEDRFILSSGHAGVALYVVLESKGIIKKASLEHLHVHPDRDIETGIDVSTGSLGQGLPIAVGMALASRERNVYVILSDGECAEGSIWESLRIAYEQKLNNLIIFICANGWGAYDPVSIVDLTRRLKGFCPNLRVVNGHSEEEIKDILRKPHSNYPSVILAKTVSDQFSFLKDQDAHYYVMTEDDYSQAKELLDE